VFIQGSLHVKSVVQMYQRPDSGEIHMTLLGCVIVSLSQRCVYIKRKGIDGYQ